MKRKGFSGEENLLRFNIEEFEKHIIVSALERTRGNQSLAAKQLGTTKRVIAYRIRKYNIALEEYYDKTGKKHK